MAEQIHTGGGPAIDGNVAARGDFVGRDANRQNSQIVNFQATSDALHQFYLILVQIQLDVGRLDSKFERQTEQLNDMRIDVNTLKVDMVSMKLEMNNFRSAMETRRIQSDSHSQELNALKIQVSGIAQTASVVSETMQGVNEQISFRGKVEAAITLLVLGGLGVWIIIQQVMQ
jgi:hypothetical protein